MEAGIELKDWAGCKGLFCGASQLDPGQQEHVCHEELALKFLLNVDSSPHGLQKEG